MKGKDIALFFGFVVMPAGLILGTIYYGPKIVRWWNGNTPEKMRESILMFTASTKAKINVSQEEWNEELKKLSTDALAAFHDWFILTIPFGKDKNSAWTYETMSPEKSDEFNKKKDALYPKYYDELAKKTKVQSYFENLEKAI